MKKKWKNKPLHSQYQKEIEGQVNSNEPWQQIQIRLDPSRKKGGFIFAEQEQVAKNAYNKT